ncbi:MAG: GDP-mannose 4,6-dehydratase [Nanoarchaeota archaeon]
MSKNVALLVGISGMDCEALAHFLLKKNYTVVGTYRKNTQLNLENLISGYPKNSDLHLEFCDINDFNSVRYLFETVLKQHNKIDEIYLLAAQSHVGNSFSSAESSVITNGMSAYNFLENIRLLTCKTKLYFAATSELLGGNPEKCPFDEFSEYECRSPYSVGKELGTRWIKYYNQTYGIYATYGILFNHSNTSRGKQFYIRRVTNSAARISLGVQNELKLGSLAFWRDEHWSDFGVEMMWKMLQLENPEIFLICRGECFHGEQFLEESFKYFNLDWREYVKFDGSRLRPNEVVKLVGTPQKAMEKLGWNPNRMSFRDHIALMCNYDYQLESNQNPKRPNIFELYP